MMEPKQTLSQKKWGWLILFASTGTLLCCALPIMLVSLGMGAVVASMATNLPFLITLSLYKDWVFAGSALLLCFGAWLLYRPGRACPTDPELAALCNKIFTWNCRLYWLSVFIWCTGFFFAYIAQYIFKV
ncbi:MAG: intracellular growth attenuator family protein [Proteobacteria bacterium]|nr:intracellular growth attenuator family protein [Pseudomonadota bacterium]